MRSDRAAAAAGLALALAACRITDPGRPIGVLAGDLNELDRANLEEAAACWNLQFGTSFVVGEGAAAADQHVEAFYDLHTCLHAKAQVQTGIPHALAICPLGSEGPGSEFIFRILSHELGHVLNIIGHPDDGTAVMQGGGLILEDMFRPVDLEMFGEANPGFVAVASCRRVVRSGYPGTSIGRCECEE